MDICSSLSSLSPARIASCFGVAVAVVHFAARIFVISTHTPVPGTRWAKVYGLIETLALEVGYAKETGLIPAASPAQEMRIRQAAVLLDHLQPK